MVSVDLEWDLECLSISDCHSTENNSLLLVADDYVLKKENMKCSQVWEEFKLLLINDEEVFGIACYYYACLVGS